VEFPSLRLLFTDNIVADCLSTAALVRTPIDVFYDLSSVHLRRQRSTSAYSTLDLSETKPVDHDCVLSVLQRRFSVDSDAMTWFRSYLADRTRTFVAGKDHHGPLPVNCSVPQGSVLSPIKFIAYTEDVSELIAQHGVSYHLFADDKQLYTAVF